MVLIRCVRRHAYRHVYGSVCGHVSPSLSAYMNPVPDIAVACGSRLHIQLACEKWSVTVQPLCTRCAVAVLSMHVSVCVVTHVYAQATLSHDAPTLEVRLGLIDVDGLLIRHTPPVDLNVRWRGPTTADQVDLTATREREASMVWSPALLAAGGGLSCGRFVMRCLCAKWRAFWSTARSAHAARALVWSGAPQTHRRVSCACRGWRRCSWRRRAPRGAQKLQGAPADL